MTGMPAAHDLDAERAVLATVYAQPERLGDLEGLLAEAFYDPRHGWQWRAILALAEAGEAIDAITVAGWLKARSRLLDAGGVPYLGEVCDMVAVVHNVAAYGALVLGHWRQRKAVAELEVLTAKLRTGAVGIEALAEAAAKLDALGGAGPARRVLSARDIARPLARIPWLCRALSIGPGRATILGGYGGVGKTFAAQAMALAVAAGHRRLWDCYELQHQGGAVLHLDYEQGEWITCWRYQRLAWSLGIDLEQLGDRLQTEHYPDIFLTDPGAEKRLVKLCTGKALVLIDSLRAACPGVDENDSRMGAYLMVLARVSERTGATFIVVHHEGKTSGENPRKGIEKLRGSSAIAASAGSVLSFVKDSSGVGVVRIEHTRANLGQEAAPELVRLLDEGQTDENTEKSVGLKLEWIPREQAAQEAVAADVEEAERGFDVLVGEVFRCVQRNPGIGGSKPVARKLKKNQGEVRSAFDQLVEDGRVVNRGGKPPKSRWFVAQDGEPGTPSYEGEEAAE